MTSLTLVDICNMQMCMWGVDESQLRRLISLSKAIHQPTVDAQLRWQRTVEALQDLVGATGGASVILSLGNRKPQIESTLYSAGQRVHQVVQKWLGNERTETSADRTIQTLRSGAAALVRTRRKVSLHAEKLPAPIIFTEIKHDCIFSFMLLSDSAAALLCLIGSNQGKLFTQTDARLVQLIHSEMQTLYLAPSDPHLVGMTPRQRQIHECLLKGYGEKQIAVTMGLSRHTVHAHVKAIYKCFHVSSRSELLARFVRE